MGGIPSKEEELMGKSFTRNCLHAHQANKKLLIMAPNVTRKQKSFSLVSLTSMNGLRIAEPHAGGNILF